MRGYDVYDGEAARPAVCAPADVVLLRPGLADVALRLARWVLTVVGMVVALWAGSMLLAAPASAAVVVPLAGASSPLKGGKEKGSGNNGGNGEQKSKGEKQKPKDEKKQKPKGDGEQKPKDEKKQKPKGDGEQKSKGEKQKPKDEKKQKPKGDGEQKPKGEKQKPKDEKKQKPKGDGEQKSKGEKQKPKGDGKNKSNPMTAADVEQMRDQYATDPDSVAALLVGNGGQRGTAGGDRTESAKGKTAPQKTPQMARNGAGEKATKAEWREFGEDVREKVDAVRTAARRGGDVRGAVRDLVRVASDTPAGDLDRHAVAKVAADYAKTLKGTGDGKKADPAIATDGTGASQKCTGAAGTCAGKDTEPTAQMLQSGRGPPTDRTTTTDYPEPYGYADDDYDDGAATEQLLKDRIAADKGERDLAAAKKKVAAGTMTAKQYAAEQKEQAAREKRLAASRENTSGDDAKLVDAVVTGQAELDRREAKLVAEAKQVKAGTVTKAEYRKHVAAYEQRRDTVYALTDELRDVTGRDSPDTVTDPGDGAAAGCGSSGMFVECRAEVAPAGDADEGEGDRCVAITGVSSGCGVSAGSGDRSASASCTLSGGDRGCTSTSRKGTGDDAVVANASYRLGSGDGGESTRATSDGATMACRSTGGGCSGDTTGPSGTSRGPAATRDRAVQKASCTGTCVIDGLADRLGAEGSCSSDAGTCDASSSGRGSGRGGGSDGDTAVQTVADRTADTGAATATGHCATKAGGCDLSTRIRVGGDDEDGGDTAATADAQTTCAAGATGCTGTATTSSNGGHTSTPAVVAPKGGAKSKQAAAAATRTRETKAAADCTVTAGGCAAHSGSVADGDDAGRSEATIDVDGTGNGATSTASTADGVTTTRDGSGKADCSVTRGRCGAASGTTADNPTDTRAARYAWDAATGTVRTVPARTTDADGAAVSSADAWVDCAAATCSGTSATATTGRIAAPGAPAASGATKAGATKASPAKTVMAVRTTKADATCTTTAGNCSSSSGSQVGDTAPAQYGAAGRSLTAASDASSAAECARAGCAGKAASGTTGGARGDVPGVRDSKATSDCTTRGAGGSCTTGTETQVQDRPTSATAKDPVTGVALVSGPVSTSDAVAEATCSGATTRCSGTTEAGTSARDTAVTTQARGTSTTSSCTVTGGGCQGRSESAASSAPDYVTIDPRTGRPVKGQALSGPSSGSRSDATLDCPPGANCSGKVTTTTTAFDGTTTTKPRTSTGTANCTAGTGGCQARSVSTAATGPGAALALAGPNQATNAARLAKGPSAASASGAVLLCEGAGRCTGSVTSAAGATDPTVSPDARGSSGTGSCEGVVGGVCQAVTNSGSSTGPDANRIAPIMAAAPTQNATVTSEQTGDQPQDQQQGAPGQDQPALPPAPTAPGSSANTGGPTVPGASSWSMADATLDCAGAAGGCAGTARSAAIGADGPRDSGHANGARGPPTGGGTTSGTCVTTQSGCRVVTSSTAASGQVVADIVAEQNKNTAAQLAQQAAQAREVAAAAKQVAARPGATAKDVAEAKAAAKAAGQARTAAKDAAKVAAKPVRNAPATLAQSSAGAECAGPACAAATTGETSGLPGRSTTSAACRAAAAGCATTSEAAASTDRGSRKIRAAGVGTTSSGILCPEAGCTGTVRGNSKATAQGDGRRATSTGRAATGCSGASACTAQVGAGTSVTELRPGRTGDGGTAITAWTSATCDDGTAAGCATRSKSASSATGNGRARATSKATCATRGACETATGATVFGDLAEATAGCSGTGCRTHTEGRARSATAGGSNTAVSRTDCKAGRDGRCAGTSQVAATDEYALAGATCSGSKGSKCSFSYRAEGHARAPGARADASAHASGRTTGGGSALASASAEPGQAQATAECTGSAGVRCRHSYSASASASAASAGSRASASASGSGGGGEGRGAVAVQAQASAAPGSASASAGCTGSAGVRCRHSYSASASDSASYGANRASAHASGSGGGGQGSGGVAVTAQASAGPGYASGSASCSGAANCRYSYSARASDSASYDDGVHRSSARAFASGSGGGSGPGGGGVSANAQAQAGKGYAFASAGCSGTSNCTTSYSSRASASKTVGGQHAEARSSCSGGGSGGSCGSQAVVKVDANSAFAQAGCSGTGKCTSHYATRSRSSGSGPGIKGDAGANCSGGRASGGACSTGSKVVHDPETGRLTASSYCATEGGTCSRWANLKIDANSPNGELTGKGGVRCSGGVGACGIVGVAKYRPAHTGADGKPVPAMLEIGTGCEKQGTGSCSQWSHGDAKIASKDGKVTGTATSRCSGTTGYCSTPVAGGYDEKTGEIIAYTDCQAGGKSTCTKSEAHITGSIEVKGKATPNGPEHGTVGGNGRSDCVKTAGPCSAYGQFTHLEPEQAYKTDKNGKPILDKDGKKIPLYETDKNGKQVLDENDEPIPVYLPRRVIVQTGCYPAGPHCSQEAHLTGDLEVETEHTKHTATAKADCAGTSGGCHLVGAVAHDPTSGKAAAFTNCTGSGGANCSKSETHAYAWAESDDGKIHGDGKSDCTETTGYCSSVSIAKYVPEHWKKQKPCPDVCFQAPAQKIPEHITTGATCETDGSAANCSYRFAAQGDRSAKDGDLSAAAKSNCSDSGGEGGGFCSVAASAKIDKEKFSAQAIAWCEGSAGVTCSYSGSAKGTHSSDKNNAEAEKSCGASRTGTCSIAVSAYTAGGDDDRQGVAVAVGMCTDTNGTCKGSFRTHVDSNRDTLADCSSDGNGLCYGMANAKTAETGGSVEDDKTVLTLHTKAPGGEDRKECSNAAPCADHWSEALDSKYMGITRETEKSVGGFFKNLVRDGGYVIVHAVPGLVGGVVTELGSWVTAAPWGEDLDAYAENRPLTGGIAKGAVGFKERWIDGDVDKIGDDYYFNPVSTALEDVGTVALVAVGAGAILKAVSLSAKGLSSLSSGVTATTTGIRGTMAATGTRLGTWAPAVDAAAGGVLRAANVGGHVAMFPLKLNFAAARFVLGKGMVAVLPRVSNRAAAGSSALLDRGMGAVNAGRTTAGVRYLGAASVLDRVAVGLRVGGPAGQVIQRGGIFGRFTIGGRHIPGLLGTLRAYDTLGLQFGRTLTPDQVAAAQRGATVSAFAADAFMGTPSGLARLIGRENAVAFRQSRIDKAAQVVAADQFLREPAGVPGGCATPERAPDPAAADPAAAGSRPVAGAPRRGEQGAGRHTDPPAAAPAVRGAVDSGITTHGRKFFSSPDKVAAFLRMTPEERARFVEEQSWTKAVLGDVRIQSLTPKNPLAEGRQPGITREQLVDAIAAAIERRITGPDGPDGPAGGAMVGPTPGPRGGPGSGGGAPARPGPREDPVPAAPAAPVPSGSGASGGGGARGADSGGAGAGAVPDGPGTPNADGVAQVAPRGAQVSALQKNVYYGLDPPQGAGVPTGTATQTAKTAPNHRPTTTAKETRQDQATTETPTTPEVGATRTDLNRQQNTAASRQAPTADQVAEVVAAAGDAPVTVAEAARRLGVKKPAVRRALENRAPGDGPAAGLELVTERGTAWVTRAGQQPGRDAAPRRSTEPAVDLSDRGALRTAVKDARAEVRREQQRLRTELAATTDPVRRTELQRELTGANGRIAQLENALDRAPYHADKAAFLHRMRAPLATVERLRSDRVAVDRLLQRDRSGARLSREEYLALVADEVLRVDGNRVGTEQIAGALLMDGVRPGLTRFTPHRIGTVIEMLTGEGKTYAGQLVAIKRALEARARGTRGGIHVLTTDPTLARTAAAGYTRITERFGLEIGLLGHADDAAARRAAYDADITVGPPDFLFDGLAENLVPTARRDAIRREFALLDEADMLLLDLGASPYRLARPVGPARRAELAWATEHARGLQPGEYTTTRGRITIGRAQARALSERLGVTVTPQMRADLVAARSAERLVEGVDFLVVDGVRVEILDSLNGRTLPGQRWTNGLHEALESRLGLPVRSAQETIAATTMRKYLRGYRDVAGMTGTAWPSRGLFRRLYGLDVVRVPTRGPSRLEIRPTEVYGSSGAWRAGLADQIVARRSAINPELVILRTPLEVEQFAAQLRERGVDVQVLSADGRRIYYEEAVTAAAGLPHAVTVATNIIGRGTDILLGGRGVAPFRRGPAAPAIDAAGGLRVTVASLFESQRALRQGFGRAARQGDRGSAGLVVSLDDPLLARHGDPVALARLRAELGDSARPIPAELVGSLVDDAVAAAQRSAERGLRAAIRGRVTTGREHVRVLDDATLGPERGLAALGERIDTLQQQLDSGRARIAGADGPALRDAVTAAQVPATQLAAALHDYRALAADIDGRPAPVAPAPASGEVDRTAAGMLGLDAAAVDAARGLVAAGDLVGAAASLRRTASGAYALAVVPGLWAGADAVTAQAQQAATALGRALAAPGTPLAGTDRQLVEAALGRLGVLVTTRPAGAAVQAVGAVHGPSVAALLGTLDRLHTAGAPARPVADLLGLAAAGRLTAADLDGLVRVASTGRHARAAQAIAGFAAAHGLDWSRAERRGLRAALRVVPRPAATAQQPTAVASATGPVTGADHGAVTGPGGQAVEPDAGPVAERGTGPVGGAVVEPGAGPAAAPGAVPAGTPAAGQATGPAGASVVEPGTAALEGPGRPVGGPAATGPAVEPATGPRDPVAGPAGSTAVGPGAASTGAATSGPSGSVPVAPGVPEAPAPGAGGSGGDRDPPGGGPAAPPAAGEPSGGFGRYARAAAAVLTGGGLAVAAAVGGHQLGALPGTAGAIVVGVVAAGTAGAGAVALGVSTVRNRGPPALRLLLRVLGGGLLAAAGVTALAVPGGWSLLAGATAALGGAVALALLRKTIPTWGLAGASRPLRTAAVALAPTAVLGGLLALVGGTLGNAAVAAAGVTVATLGLGAYRRIATGGLRSTGTGLFLLGMLAAPAAALWIAGPAVALSAPPAGATLAIALFGGGYGLSAAVVARAELRRARELRRAAVQDAPVAGSAREVLRRLGAALGTTAGGDAVVALVDAERALTAARDAADRAPGDPQVAAALLAAENTRRRAADALHPIAGWLLVDVVRLGITDRRVAAALDVPTVVATILTADARAATVVATAEPRFGIVTSHALAVQRDRVAAAAADVEAARTRVAHDRVHVDRFRADVETTVRSGVRWLMHPQGRRPGRAAELRRIAAALDIPVALARAYAADPGIRADVPPAVGATPGKHRSFAGDLELVTQALQRSVATLGRAELRYGEAVEAWHRAVNVLHDTVEDAVREGLAGGFSHRRVGPAVGVPAAALAAGAGGGPRDVGAGLAPHSPGSPRLRPSPAGTGRDVAVAVDAAVGPPIRGPPWARWIPFSRARAALRAGLRAQDALWVAWQELDRAAADAQADYRALREATVAAAGGLTEVLARPAHRLAPAASDAQAREHRAAVAALDRARRVAAGSAARAATARQAFVAAATPVVAAAGAAGLPVATIMRRTGLGWPQVSRMTGLARPDPGLRNPRWDRVYTAWLRTWAMAHPGRSTVLPNGQVVSTRWLEEQFRKDGITSLGMVDARIAALIGTNRMPVYDLSDGHFHHIGYDDPRESNIAGFLRRLAADGQQGVITFHPIPQRGIGVATAGGTFYYAVANALTLGLVFGTPMLRMWGTFPDVRLVDAVRRLPPDLAWRAVMGVTGARLDVPGAQGYLQAMAVLNPDLAALVGETTIAKEAVRDLLGDEAVHVLNPEWERQVRRVVAAAGVLHDLLATPGSGLTTAQLPSALRSLSTVPAANLIGTLLGEIDAVRDLLAAHGHARAADQLLSAAELAALPVHNPNVAELLQASSDVGYLTVLHNDWGLARILADGRFGEEVPDERFGMPLLALLKQYPDAKVVLAHLGVGKWTTLSVEHLKLIGKILADRDYAHVSFDISWNEVARHLQATPEITDAFVDLVRAHPTRIVFGSDAVKPESLPQYYRHAHDMELIFARIRDEVGLDAFHALRHDNLERLLADARSDVQRWAYVQLTSGAWDGFRRSVDAARNAVIDRWLERYELAVGAPSAAERAAVEIVDTAELLRTDRPGAQQVRDLLRWSDAVDHRVRSGRLSNPKLIMASLRAARANGRELRDLRARRAAERDALPAGDTAGLAVRDPDGAPWTLDALIAAHQSLLATGDSAVADRVLTQVQGTELAQRADAAEIAKLRTRFVRLTWAAVGVTAVALGTGAAWLLPLAPVASAWAFAVRGALNAQRTVHSQQLRRMTESILEGGQFDRDTLRALIAVIGKHAALDRMPAWRLNRFDQLARQTMVDAIALVEAPLGDQESAQSRFETSLKEFSIFLDKAGSILGIQAQSLGGNSAHSGLLGRTVNTVLAGTFVVNLAVHVAATAAAVSGGGALALAVNGVFALADALFLAHTLPVMVAGWAGYDANLAPRIRRIAQAWAMPVVTVANFLLSVQMAFVDHTWLAVAGVGLTVSTAYLSWLGIAAELRLGRLPPRRGATANLVLSASLLAVGLAAVVPASGWPAVLGVTAAGGALMWVASRMDGWRAKRVRGPPPARAVRDATAADLARITDDALVHPDGHGVVLVAPGDRLRAYGLDLRTAPGETTVVVHGDERGFWYLIDGVEVRLRGAQLAGVLAGLGVPAPAVTGVALCACSVGAAADAPDGAVRELARGVGLPVVAATSTVTVLANPALGSRVESGGWVRIDGDRPVEPVAAPPALVAPITVPGAQRIGPPGLRLPIEPRAPPAQAGIDRATSSARWVVRGVLVSAGIAGAVAAATFAEPWLWAGLGGVAVVAVRTLVRQRAGAKRATAWAARMDAWNDVRSAVGTGPTVVVVLRWLLADLPADGAGVPLADIGRRRTGAAELATLSAHLAGLPGRAGPGQALNALVDTGIVRIETAAGGPTVVASGAFADLWARAPDALRAALAADPAAVLGIGRLSGRSAGQLAEAVLALLQDAVWDQAAVRPGMVSRLPLWLRGGRGQLRSHFATLRAAGREIDALDAELGAARRALAVATRSAAAIEAAGRARATALHRLIAARGSAGPRRVLAVPVAAAGVVLATVAHTRLLRRLPAQLRGIGPDRAVAAAAERVRELEQRVPAVQERERAVAAAATAAAAGAGFTRRQVVGVRTAAMLGWSRFMAPVVGAFAAFPGQASSAQSVASTEYADHYGQPVPWVTEQGAVGSSMSAAAGLAAASLGDRLIATMLPIVALGAAGSLALVVIGASTAAALFLPSLVLVGVMSTAGGLARGRMDRLHPAAAEVKDTRDRQYETAYRAVQLVLPAVIAQSAAVAGVAATSIFLAVLGALLTGAIWVVLRGAGRGGGQPRAPPAIGAALRGSVVQVVATPSGMLRALASIPLFTVLAGLYAYALGGALIDQLVLVNDPTHAVFATTATAVSVLVTARGVATMFVGPAWKPLKQLLGARGALARTLGRDVPVAPVDEARVLMAVALLPLAIVGPLVWLVVAPGLVPFGVVLTAGAVFTAWARMPVSRWKEGATGASLINTARAGSIALGAALSSAVLGGFSTAVTERVDAGLPHADLVATANLHLALLAVPVLVAPIVLARLIGVLRVGTLDDLRVRLSAAGGGVVTVATVAAKLAAHGVDDIGSARALFGHDGWAPRIAADRRRALREWRRESVGLAPGEHDLLLSAVAASGRKDVTNGTFVSTLADESAVRDIAPGLTPVPGPADGRPRGHRWWPIVVPVNGSCDDREADLFAPTPVQGRVTLAPCRAG